MDKATEIQPQIGLNVLGEHVAYPQRYAPEVLVAIPRAEKRAELGYHDAPPFLGADLWTAYELSWLNAKGKPQVAVLRMVVPCETPCIVESKSLKLYLNSFSQEAIASADELKRTIARDVGAVVWGKVGEVDEAASASATSSTTPTVGITLIAPEAFAQQRIVDFEGQCVDRLDTECSIYTPTPELLHCVPDEDIPVEEVLYSHLLKSNCLVTHQPDWGSVAVAYTGLPIDQEGFLRYVVSFRNHYEFHEQCVERIYHDIMQRCKPLKLSVYARYTRRGGIDINPFRSSYPQPLPSTHRHARQ